MHKEIFVLIKNFLIFCLEIKHIAGKITGTSILANATVKIFTLRAALNDAASMEHPDAIRPIEGTVPFEKDMSFKIEPYSVLVVEVTPK